LTSTFLLDVNVLVALAWPSHQFHGRVRAWFAAKVAKNWATCPFTQAGFLRVISNPAFSRGDVRPVDALRVLETNLNHPGHHFWPNDLNLREAFHKFRLTGHQQITDAYLLALAIHHKGKLATVDKSIQDLVVAGRMESGHVELVPAYFT
jgi:uncharacterized protein